MKKQSGYKYLIEQALHKDKWEIKEIDSSGEWWDTEHWKVEYEYDSKIQFFIYFVLDPLDNKRVAEITVFQNSPENPFDIEKSIASISMSKRKFDIKLKKFISDLKNFKNQYGKRKRI